MSSSLSSVSLGNSSASVCATSIALLTECTTAELKAMTHDQLADLIRHRGRHRFDDPHAPARAMQQALRSSYPVDPQMDEMVTAALAAGWDHIRFIKRPMKRLDKLIARHIDPVPNPIITVKELGSVITAGTASPVAEIVDISRFPEHRHLAQYVGLTWEKRPSGRFLSQHTRLTKVGNSYLRYYLVLGSNTLRQFNLEYRAYYW